MDSIHNKKYFLAHNEKDDYIDSDDWIPPKAVIRKIVSQIEYYLSDENLAKDAFLLKHVRRNKMGYINIKLLTSFKKMKQFTKDWRVTAYALQHSLILEVNKEGTKVRRIEPVPESVLFQVPSRLLLVWNVTESNLTEDMAHKPSTHAKSTIETAIRILEPFGTITMARVNRPGRDIPPELQKYSYRYPELFTKESILVEYEDLEGAGRAYHRLSQSEGNIKVLLVEKSSKKKAANLEDKCNKKGISIQTQQTLQLQNCEDSLACSYSESEFASSSPLNTTQFLSSQMSGSPLNSPRSSPRYVHAPMHGPHISPFITCEIWKSPEISTDLREKYKLCINQNKHGQTSEKRLHTGVLRLPYGPDESRGFHAVIFRRRFNYS